MDGRKHVENEEYKGKAARTGRVRDIHLVIRRGNENECGVLELDILRF
jgi:hypothetical protein